MKLKRLGLVVAPVLTAAASIAAGASASSGTPTVQPTAIADSQLQALTTTIGGGVSVLSTTRTVPHWWGSTLDPQDGITYGYNMVGADPNTCAGAACNVTVQVDITPIVLNLDGMTFSGSDVLPATLVSPLFASNDYGSTPYATTGDFFTAPRGPGGVLSQGDAGDPLQLQDATMRAEFDKVGASTYHLRLQPNVLPAVTINVPQNQGILLLQPGAGGVVFAGVQYLWFEAQLERLAVSADPTHLALYLSDDTWLLFAHGNKFGCCIGGFHGALPVAGAHGPIANAHSSGEAPVQTMVWAPYLSPGVFVGPNGSRWWALQDIDTLSHEVSEWAHDPFVDNFVQAWPLVPPVPQDGCSNVLETGDPVGNAGFAIGTNTFRQGPNPNGTQSADGFYHPEDEVTLPWFVRLAPNLVSEPTQTPSPDIGRYTFMGSLDQFTGLTEPPQLCTKP
jgi:hypothetical protein